MVRMVSKGNWSVIGNFNIFEFPGGGWGPDPRPDPQSLDTCMALAFLDYFDLPKNKSSE